MVVGVNWVNTTGVPSKVTLLVPVKSVPVMVTVVPRSPAAAGRHDVTAGAAT